LDRAGNGLGDSLRVCLDGLGSMETVVWTPVYVYDQC